MRSAADHHALEVATRSAARENEKANLALLLKIQFLSDMLTQYRLKKKIPKQLKRLPKLPKQLKRQLPKQLKRQLKLNCLVKDFRGKSRYALFSQLSVSVALFMLQLFSVQASAQI